MLLSYNCLSGHPALPGKGKLLIYLDGCVPDMDGTVSVMQGQLTKDSEYIISKRQNCSTQMGTSRDGLFSSPSLYLSTPKLFLTDGHLAFLERRLHFPSRDMHAGFNHVIRSG